MPLSDADRARLERELQEALAAVWGDRAAELQRLLGDPPDPNRVPQEFWAATDTAALAALAPIMAEMAQASAESLAAGVPPGVTYNWDVVNQRAADWAAQYTYDLVKNIGARTQSELQRLVSAFFSKPGQDLQGLAAEIAKLFGPVRGEMIATTEVTRAAAEGEQRLLDEIKLLNPDVRMAEFWQTSNDEIVCSVCGPMNHVQGDGRGNFKSPKTGDILRIPAHPRCRCARRSEVVKLP
jgi:hypothetical protein